MKVLKATLVSKEVNEVLGILDAADQKFDYPMFQTMKNAIKQAVLAQPDVTTQKIRAGLSPRQSAYSMIANLAGDLAESGQFHMDSRAYVGVRQWVSSEQRIPYELLP